MHQRYNLLVGATLFLKDNKTASAVVENISEEGIMFNSDCSALSVGDQIELTLINVSPERIKIEIIEKNVIESDIVYNSKIIAISEDMKNMVIPTEQNKIEEYFLRSVELAIEKVFRKFLKRCNLSFHSSVLLEPEELKLELSSAIIFYRNFKGCAIISMEDKLVEKVMEVMGLTKMKMDRAKIVQETLKEFSNMIFGSTATNLSEIYNIETSISVPVILKEKKFDKKNINFLQSEIAVAIDAEIYKTSITFLVN